MSSRFQFVDDHRGAFGVKRLCRMLKLSRSGFYRWPAGADAELAERIAGIHAEPDGTYGAPRVTAELRDDGVRVNHKRVARVIRAGGIVGFHPRKKVRTTIPERQRPRCRTGCDATSPPSCRTPSTWAT
ncbi:transposase [Streptomyces acidiscabies]|nr:transposase [Streptomyces acidiscabies]